jgi:ribonuclease-3
MIDDKKLFADISYRFDDLALLKDALTHTNNSKKKNLKFQRLEFLGDRILGLAIADILYHKFTKESEGDLTRRMHTLVNEETLAKIAKEINIGEHIILSYNEEKAGGRNKNTILADTLEAIIAAIYLDKSYASVFEFVSQHWDKYLSVETTPPIDPKTKLQEWCQSKGFNLPLYNQVEKSGPDHSPEFIIKVVINAEFEIEGLGLTKKQAERRAASNALLSEYVLNYEK